MPDRLIIGAYLRHLVHEHAGGIQLRIQQRNKELAKAAGAQVFTPFSKGTWLDDWQFEKVAAAMGLAIGTPEEREALLNAGKRYASGLPEVPWMTQKESSPASQEALPLSSFPTALL